MPYHEIAPSLRLNYTVHHPTSTSSGKPWIILVNGLADPQTTWSLQTPAFTYAGYTVLTYDNRGVGLSSRPTGDEVYTASDMASDLRSLVTALDVPKPYHLMGVSMGGMILQAYALDYLVSCPGEALSVTLACTYSAPGPFCSRMFALWRDMAQRMSIADVMRDVALWAFTPPFFADPNKAADLKAMEDEMSRIDADMGLRAYLAQLNVITDFDTRQHVGELGGGGGGDVGGHGVEVTKPMEVIVLAGEQDILIPVDLSKELHGLIKGSRWQTTRGGHACMWEFPDEFNKACLVEWKGVEELERTGMK